jgi:hypothetical protein
MQCDNHAKRLNSIQSYDGGRNHAIQVDTVNDCIS